MAPRSTFVCSGVKTVSKRCARSSPYPSRNLLNPCHSGERTKVLSATHSGPVSERRYWLTVGDLGLRLNKCLNIRNQVLGVTDVKLLHRASHEFRPTLEELGRHLSHGGARHLLDDLGELQELRANLPIQLQEGKVVLLREFPVRRPARGGNLDPNPRLDR